MEKLNKILEFGLLKICHSWYALRIAIKSIGRVENNHAKYSPQPRDRKRPPFYAFSGTVFWRRRRVYDYVLSWNLFRSTRADLTVFETCDAVCPSQVGQIDELYNFNSSNLAWLEDGASADNPQLNMHVTTLSYGQPESGGRFTSTLSPQISFHFLVVRSTSRPRIWRQSKIERFARKI